MKQRKQVIKYKINKMKIIITKKEVSDIDLMKLQTQVMIFKKQI